MFSYHALLLALTVVGLFLGFVSFLGQNKLTHRVLALDLMSLVSASVMGVYAVFMDDPIYLDIIIVWALVNFLGTVAFALYIHNENVQEQKEG